MYSHHPEGHRSAYCICPSPDIWLNLAMRNPGIPAGHIHGTRVCLQISERPAIETLPIIWWGLDMSQAQKKPRHQYFSWQSNHQQPARHSRCGHEARTSLPRTPLPLPVAESPKEHAANRDHLTIACVSSRLSADAWCSQYSGRSRDLYSGVMI